MKIAFFSAKSYDRDFFDRYNKVNTIHYFDVSLSLQTINLAQGCNAVCVFVNDILNEKVIEQLAALGIKVIALRCAGFNNVDLDTAHRLDIPVVRVPAYSPHAVAEHAVALVLTLNRKTHKAYNRVREGNFSLETLTGFDLFEKTVGVVGTGRIGQAFCDIMLGFGCKVLAFDIIANKELEVKGVVYLPFTDLLEQSDIISLHCPLTELTHHLINEDTMKFVKAGAMLINTSRGALIDARAAIEALKSRQLAYLGIDVYEQEEKLFFNDLSGEVIQDDLIMRLISFPNVLITAHQGFFTSEALTQIAHTTLENISCIEEGRTTGNKL
ncbi:MAG: 2-hydroxyacid dehydrogenase [Chitinophagaceae bacterium]